jgi:uncharacterized protein YndB with AHSA1/START domain
MTDALDVTTPSDTEVLMSRAFDAPRELVFDCWTKPELIRRWMFGPDGWSFAVCEVDLRVGGAYRFVWRSSDGEEMGLGGVYHEIVRAERLVSTERYDQDWTGGETLGTVVFAEHGARTTVTTTIRYASKEARDAALRTGMEQGMAMGYDRLAAVLRSIG